MTVKTLQWVSSLFSLYRSSKLTLAVLILCFRTVFGPKRDEVAGEWRKLHNEELHNLIKSRRMRWAGHVARIGEKRNAYRLLVRKPEGRRPLGRPRRRWLDSIRMDLVEVGWGGVDWIGLAQDRDRWRAQLNGVS
jgi:hypothetical protein